MVHVATNDPVNTPTITTTTTTYNGGDNTSKMDPFKLDEKERDQKSKQKSRYDQMKKVWRNGVVTFSNNTTLHGVRYVLTGNIGLIRRCLWLLLLVLCSSYMGVQIIQRVLQYYNHPSNVMVKINFNKTLNFPALTLCNQNAFRASLAAKKKMYGLIDDLFSPDDSAGISRRETINYKDYVDVDTKNLYTSTAHDKHDLIVECKWKNEICGPENFTEVLTDHGVCYTFNGDKDSPLWISSAGSDHGIKLTLNVEQYEYMPGPHDAAGIKVLLHDRKEFPNVANLGHSIPTGAHAYVGMQLIRVENLPEPHGSCRSDSSPYYTHYSPDACQLACFTQFMAEVCYCRDMYMPSLNDYPPVCSLYQYVNCFRVKTAEVHRRVEDECYCPVPCNFLLYDSTISFSTTSDFAHERLLAMTNTDKLKHKYLAARETTFRMNPLKFNVLTSLEASATSSFKQMDYVMTSVCYSRLRSQKMALENIYKNMKATWDRKKYLLQYQEYHVTKNFIRARQAMEERSVFSALLNFQEFGYQIESRIHQLAQPPSNLSFSAEMRMNLYMEALNMINGRVQLCDKAFDNYTQLYESYLNGTPIFGYKYLSEPRADNNFMTPKKLLKDSLSRTYYTRKYSSRVGTDLRYVQKYIRMYEELLNKSYTKGEVHKDDLHRVNILFYNRGRQFYQSRSEFYSESVEYPGVIMKSKHEDFDRKWRLFESNYHTMLDFTDTILNNLVHLNNSLLSPIKQGMDSTDKYISFGNVSKHQAATELTSEAIHVGLNNLKTFFDELRSRAQNIYDGWSVLLRSTNDIWEVILNDENMYDYYVHKNLADFLRNYTTVSKDNEKVYNNFRELYDSRFIVKNTDTFFLIQMEKLIEHMKHYIQESRLDSHFIKDNFVQLDVFYREKSYEQITQQPAYDIFALICDIGGSMGLFIGASVLTLYEILEMFLHVFLIPMAHKMVKTCGTIKGRS